VGYIRGTHIIDIFDDHAYDRARGSYTHFVVPPLGRMPPRSAKPKNPTSLPSAPTRRSSRPTKGKRKSDATHEPAESQSSPVAGDSRRGRDVEADKTSANPKKKRKQKAIGGPATSLFRNLFLLPGCMRCKRGGTHLGAFIYGCGVTCCIWYTN
jgi:hypothetical protein